MKKLIITSIILTLSFSVNAQSWWNSKKVRGNGNITTETRKTSDYDGVSVGGNFDVELVKGKEGKITLEGEENLLKYIEVEVKRGILKIQVEKGVNIRTTRKLVVTVPFTDIEKVSLSGSGDLRSKETIKADKISFSIAGSGNMNVTVDANEVKTNIAGSGNIKVDGKTMDLSCNIAGSGDINAYGLKATSTSAKIAGSGNIRTSVSDKISSKVVGSGNIYYKGNPDKIESKSLGSGSVISRN
tara:strand:+ start:2645 stop:3373 length:729 start_codon:yes stop_codon:yes gene_type:complete